MPYLPRDTLKVSTVNPPPDFLTTNPVKATSIGLGFYHCEFAPEVDTRYISDIWK